MKKLALSFREDDLTGTEIRELVAHHLRGMEENSPPGTCSAFDVDALKQPDVTLWSAWAGAELIGMGGLKAIDRDNGEIKSMRVADNYLGKGAGRALLEHLMAEARARKMSKLLLETGSSAGFMAALKLYESDGFSYCGPFADYEDNSFSRFMMREL
jgi:putative acetyltransferase